MGLYAPNLHAEGDIPPIISALIVRPMNASQIFVADSFHIKKLRSRLSSYIQAFTGLCICAKIVVGEVTFYVKIWRILTHPLQPTLQNADIQSVFAPIASAITPSKTFQ